MPDYVFRLHDGKTSSPRAEIVPAIDDEEAVGLAEMRLLLSNAFTEVEVLRGDQLVHRKTRQEPWAR